MDKAIQNILIVDDEKSNIDILRNLFEKVGSYNKYNIFPALSGEKALKIVEKKEINLILLDIMMPDMDGYEVCKILKANDATKHIPILFITSSTDEDSILKAYDLGAVDYVTKPFKAAELFSRIKVNLQLQQTIQKLEFLAYYDSMTNVYNRRKFFELSEDKFATQKENLYAIMIDIDKFKSINDTYGHSAGDKVIKEIARMIKKSLDEDMILGRLGGEEFAVVLNGEDNNSIFSLIESIRKEIETFDIVINPDLTINCTISSGVGKYNESISTIDQLLHKADEALYESKQTGRNKSIFRI